MTPKLVFIRDRRTGKVDFFRYPNRDLPPLVNPERPAEVQDSKGRPAPVVPSKVKDGAGTLNNRKPS